MGRFGLRVKEGHHLLFVLVVHWLAQQVVHLHDIVDLSIGSYSERVAQGFSVGLVWMA